tara:strand:+ start:858 stop:1313 length:456 start_codon:yes stop_codon:yes gene_type:complete
VSAELNELKRHEGDWDSKILSNLILMNRVYRPDEWTMDELASMALELEDRNKELERVNRNPLEEMERLEARIKDLESEDWCRTALKYQARIKELESDEILDGMKAECISKACVQIDDEIDGDYNFDIPWTEMKEIYKMMHNSKMRLLGTGK